VIIVDDHAVVRTGLATFLKAFDDLALVGEASCGEEALQMCIQAQPDVLLMDLVMPGMGGVEAIRAIRQQCPASQVVVLTSFAERQYIQAALKAGAISYLQKNVSAEDLASAIRGAAVGRTTLSAEASQVVLSAARNEPALGYDLTVSEKRLLALMVGGLSNQQIAEELMISLSTVKFHVSNILTKLGVNSRTEAVALALRCNLVS
jgi:NarL family two-component system response regulator LiaR